MKMKSSLIHSRSCQVHTAVMKAHILFCHLGTGQVTKLSLPLYLGDDWMGEKGNEPYRELFITITFQSPFIAFHPPQILFIPIPLENKVTATLTLHASGYPRLVSVQFYNHFYFTHHFECNEL